MNNRRRFFRNAVVVLLSLIIIGGYFYWKKRTQTQPEKNNVVIQREKGKSGRRQLPPAPVQVAVARVEDVPQYLIGLGTLVATNTATVRSPVSGQLIAIHFKEGQTVKQGQLLAELDPRPFQVALSQAQGQLARDQETLSNAQRDVARYEKLAKTHLVSDQELDAKRSLVAQTLGSIKTGEANVASAKLNLTYSRITAPISGRTGLKQVDIGNYISSGDAKGIVIITQSDPIEMLFSLPENIIPDIITAKKNQPSLLVEAWDRSNQRLIASGKLLTLDNQIDTTTGTIKLKARFDNQEDKLFSNQFVNARLKIDTLKNAIVIPTGALQMGSEGNFVWTLNDENKVTKKNVTSSFQDKEKVVIASGLNTGERVVTDGLDRLTEGAKVDVITPQHNKKTSSSTTLITGAND